MASRYDGLLEVVVRNAKNLKPMNWVPGTKSDPFCIITLEGAESVTPTKWGTLEPVWEDHCCFFVKDRASARVLCRVLDDNVITSDSLIGSAVVPLHKLENKHWEEIQCDLSSGGGQLFLTMQFHPFANAESVGDQVLGVMGTPVVGSLPKALKNSRWKSLQRSLVSAEAAADLEFDPIAFIENKETDTQVWLFWNNVKKTVVVSFRGTEQTEWKDLLTDASLVPTVIDYDEGDLRDSIQPVERETLWVHSGFLKSYLSVKREIFEMVEQITSEQMGSWTVYFTGHSLGGALATLCAYDVAMRNKLNPGMVKELMCFSFGSPMVGGQVFTESFNMLVPKCWRIVNENDGVSQVPRMIGYSHGGRKVLLKKKGVVQFCDVEYMDVGEDLSWNQVAQKLAQLTMMSLGSEVIALGKVEDAEKQGSDIDLDKIIDSEISAMRDLLDGSGIEEHMEEFYLESIREAMTRTIERNAADQYNA